ncbi:MAG: restriction endonuclease, partial [Acidobacteriota bacterium]
MSLRFDELSPREFEEVCLALLRAEGHTETRHVGAAGKDFGWDLRTRDPEGRICCVQCKRKPTVGPPEAVRELNKAWKHREQRPFDVWMLMASADLSAITEDKLAEADADRPFELIGKSDLEGRIQEHPRIRDRFFAGDRAKAQVAYLSACRADRDLASTLRGDLQANL